MLGFSKMKFFCRFIICRFFFYFFCLIFVPSLSFAHEWSGYFASEVRLFPQAALDSGQHGDNLSLVAEPEYYHEWDDGNQSFTFTPFFRFDQHDDERTHFDIRELTWMKVGEDWELRVGIRKVFWGVVESQHLVDIINQTDLIENIDTEDKLGQPMVNLALIREWGTFDFFLLPGFRERTFPGRKGRLRFPLLVETDRVEYESGAKRHHLDLALRWSHTIGDWDIGIAHFYGTSREPRYLPDFSDPEDPVLIPFYDLIHQTSLDLQATKGDWLWKLETIYRTGMGDPYLALTGGFEYTLVGLFGTPWDLGLLSEYLYDDRGKEALTTFENDVIVGLRFALNDMQSTEALFGLIFDRQSHARFWNLETSRRIGESWKLSLEARIFENIPLDDFFAGFRKDDYLQVEMAWYF